jgi:hypothetical protein
MKRLLIAVLLLLPSTAVGQAKFFGFTAGASLSDYSDDWGGYETDDRWGFTAGFIAGIRTSNYMAISIEPSFTQMGGGDFRADYLEFPLTFGGVARSGDGSMRYGGYTGITGAFKLSCSDDTGITSVDACGQLKGSAWFIPIGMRILRRTNETTFIGIDIKYDIPLGSSFDIIQANQRSWAFRLVMVKGAVPGI